MIDTLLDWAQLSSFLKMNQVYDFGLVLFLIFLLFLLGREAPNGFSGSSVLALQR